VSIFLPDLPQGGTEKVMLRLAKGFVARGIAVDMILGTASGALLKAVPPGIRVVDLGAGRVLAATPGLSRYLTRERVDILLTGKDHASVVGWWARKLSTSSTRVIATVHTPPTANIEGYAGLTGRLLPHAVRFTLPRCDAVVAVSEAVAADLRRGLPSLRRLTVIENPVLGPDIFEAAASPSQPEWLDESGRLPVVLFVGRLAPVKNLPMLIEGFARLQEQCAARLVVVGDGPERIRLETMVRSLGLNDRVHFTGFVATPYPLIARASVLALTSDYEGLPTVLIEALALGTPVVATDCPGGTRALLQDGRLGALVPVGDRSALTAALLQAIERPPHLDVCDALTRFQSDHAVESYIALMHATLHECCSKVAG
jgi:glycosyltransferase involved in cell wall biosynthesis